MNLFSIFDPQTVFLLPNNWVILFFMFSIYPPILWAFSNQSKLFIFISISSLSKELKAILTPIHAPPTLLFMITVFFFILPLNTLGLNPYVFTPSSHLALTLSMALPLWLGHVFWFWFKTPSTALSHLMPLGTPTALMPFMVIIELISNFIRPITLSVRLAANMVAGHLLLSLLGQQCSKTPMSFIIFSLSLIILLSVLEAAVAIIQSYVFSVLSTLYINEVTTLKINK